MMKIENHHKNLLTLLVGFPILFAIDIYIFKNQPDIALSNYMAFPLFLLVSVFLHRYFSHRSFQLSRPFEMIIGFLCASLYQNDPAWWASIHRRHHQNSDTAKDPHSPHVQGLWYSGFAWPYQKEALMTDKKLVGDLLAKPDLKFYNDHPYFAPYTLGAIIFTAIYFYFASQGALYADFFNWSTYSQSYHIYLYAYLLPCIIVFMYSNFTNVLLHTVGRQDHDTHDQSRNSFLMALLLLGEGWHNHHHKYPSSPRMGLKWWHVDWGYYFIWLLKLCRVAR